MADMVGPMAFTAGSTARQTWRRSNLAGGGLGSRLGDGFTGGFEFFLHFKFIFRGGHINRLWKSGLTMMFRSVNYFWPTLKMDSVVV